MSTQLDEGQLRFVFGDEWQVERYDRGELGEQGHSYYRNQVSRLPNTKAVDFMALLNGEDVYFIEIKDFRNYRIENKTRLTSGELALEVAHKVRDTLAGLMGATRNESPATILSETTGLIINRTKTVRVAEHPYHPDPESPSLVYTSSSSRQPKHICSQASAPWSDECSFELRENGTSRKHEVGS
jgi:hypothetical protein